LNDYKDLDESTHDTITSSLISLLHNMDAALSIVFQHLPITTFRVWDLLRLMATSKTLRSIAEDQLSYMCKECTTLVRNKKGHRIPERLGTYINELIPDGQGFFVKTKAIKLFKLDRSDFESLNYIIRYNPHYYQKITYYPAKEVIGMAMLKHQQSSYANLVNYLSAPKPSKARDAREHQLDKALAIYQLEDQRRLRLLPCCQQFLKNGSIGITQLKSTIASRQSNRLF
jgi:hypothetical protein